VKNLQPFEEHMEITRHVAETLRSFFTTPEEVEGPKRYDTIRRSFCALMLLITLVPLILMALVNHHQYQSALKDEIVDPMKALVNKTKHSFELFLTNRTATVRFIATAYSYDELADEKRLNRIFRSLKQEFEGFVDLGLIDAKGVQVSYAGPYDLRGKTYADQGWFQQLRVNSVYISDVFLGYRKFPHVVIAVQHLTDSGESWIVRATIDTRRFDEMIAAMGLDSRSDVFIINRDGALQTTSKFYGKVLEKRPEWILPISNEPEVVERTDRMGREVLVAYTHFNRSDFVLMVVKPKAEVLKAWYTLKSELLLVFVASVLIIILVVMRLARVLVDRLRISDEKRELAFREMQHTHKLSSIGRLAAGVAHEVNNPMAIINEKAGLMKDLIELNPSFPQREKFLGLIQAITHSVDRCRAITHRLLGFAKRMEVEIEVLDINEVIKETVGFLEKEALHRNINLRIHLAPDLPRIASDRGQLQQVFLNILNNAFAAVSDGGTVSVATWEKDLNHIGVSFQDDGVGMSEDTLKHLFEPFFTTKKASGTGLGLSITYGIVKKLGGDVEVQSKLGQGSRFLIFLPKNPKGMTESEHGRMQGPAGR
jgi:two-component system, NtrC family, sensor kinase